jgi:hypothetical protein
MHAVRQPSTASVDISLPQRVLPSRSAARVAGKRIAALAPTPFPIQRKRGPVHVTHSGMPSGARRQRSRVRPLASPLALLMALAAPLAAQTVEDGLFMPAKALCTGFLYSHDSWNEYWEGTLKRTNGNIGTISTDSLTWAGNYGITDRLNVIAMLPYVWTSASQGVLQSQSGIQDLSVSLKFKLLETAFTGAGSLRAIAVASVGAPASHYTPDLLPLSIGSHASRFGARATLFFQAKAGWFVNATGAYTWRGNVTLDRPAYYTDGELHMSDEVAMPDVIDYTLSAGYIKGRLQLPFSYSQQITLGGGDIRRQDMPFVSNRMNLSRVDGLVMYALPRMKGLSLRASAAYTVSGRNVGQATTLTAGLLYAIAF